ncbi:hypothetical protein LJB95_00065 [Paludibacteraceae bacterium OttesenSCG-928-F17]|nr:hypothetical protein [Paludibacteraceae bacterium OttesenSCG-928-F17]
MEWLLKLKDESPYDINLVFVNTDLQADWGLQEGKKIKVKIKYRGDKSASLDFGKIPYEN